MFLTATTNKYLYSFLLLLAGSIFFAACTTIKNYPVNRPFVYQTNIEVSGKYSTDEKKTLLVQLDQQLHDSMRVRSQRKFLFWHTMNKPAVYDSANAGKSSIYMSALLNSLGYYRDSISFKDTVKVVGDQYRTTVNFTVVPGKLIRLDSVWYDLTDSVPASPRIDTLQSITAASLGARFIHKGDPFSKPLISAELDRLSDVYRNNGYLRFSRDQLLGVWDTVGVNLLRFTVDPAEQLEQLEALRRRRENPTSDLEIRLVPQPDTSRLVRYYVGQVKIYPDFNADTSFYLPKIDTLTANRYQFISYQGLFKARKLIRFIYLQRGELYRQSNYLRTQNKFNSLGTWRLVTINQLPRPGEDTVDFEVKLVPAKKYTTSVNLDVSRNQGNIGSEGNLVGLGATFTLINRNFAKSAAQASTNLRYGIELTSRIDSIQTQQFTLSHTIQFPRIVPRLQWLPREWREDGRTFLNFNLGYTDRIDYYNVSTLNTSWGYEFTLKNLIIGVRFPNIEYNLVQRRKYLDSLIKTNASYKYIFNDGLIISGLITANWITGTKNRTTVKRGSIELAGLPGFLQDAFPDAKMYHFVKIDLEVVQTYKIRRSAFAWRAFGGVGYAIPMSKKDGSIDSANLFMPFFRQYYAGGPNSMRAWTVRKLGPGSSIKSFDRNIAPDRFGDVRLEFNAEYRYYMTQVFGYTLEGALFTDIGNVWFRRKNDDFSNGEFKWSRLPKDLAVGVGTGFRIDFGFLKARFDFAYKAKDPSPEDPAAQSKWFYKWRPGIGDRNGRQGAQFQLGINYPF
jgi:outer membrane protein assembly factor BamA